jgi:predicted nucleic acid-binding protein
MKVLIDTSLWSLAFRRRPADLSAIELALVSRFRTLLREGRATLIGPVRQEILTGIRDTAHFKGLRRDLGSYPDEPLAAEDFESAAEISNTCRAAGVAGSPIDFLICSVSLRRDWEIFTTDKDFQRYAVVVPLKLFRP